MTELLKKQIQNLPRTPGVYLFRGAKGSVLYVGKATVLRTRVASYFQKRKKGETRPIEEAMDQVVTIEAIKTETVIEALMLEAVLIKKYWPKYNVLGKDGRSFLYVGVTRDDFPKVLLIRGKQLDDGEYDEKKDFVALFGPYTQATSIRNALKIVRKIFKFSSCKPPKTTSSRGGTTRDPERTAISRDPSLRRDDVPKGRACFYRGIGLCPGVCTGEIKKRPYRKTIRHLIKFFQGKRKEVIIDLKKEMKKASELLDFERAGELRNQIRSLEHIHDIAVLGAERHGLKRADIAIDVFGRIEGYDISNIQGKYAVGSMVVAVGGHPEKQEYRKFTIKDVEGSHDVAMLEEVIRRRFTHDDWERPELLLIDGGLPQVNRVKKVLRELEIEIPVVGIAKGAARKKNQFIIPKQKKTIQEDLKQIARLYTHILIALRDESHRFAQSFYRLKHRKAIQSNAE